MAEPHHVAFELDQVVEAARAAGDQWREFLRAGMFSAGVYRLCAGEIDRQTPHAADSPACPGTSIGRANRQSRIVSSEPPTMSRSLAIRRPKSSASSGERRKTT